jgi:NAD(P)H-quinone oxidoreductase subunit 5
VLHVLAHSLYKAHAFLSSGSVIDIARASWTPSPGGKPHPARLAISIIAVMAVTVTISSLFGATLADKPGAFTLGAVLVLAMIMLISNGIDERPNGYVVVRTVVLAAVVTLVYFSLQFLIEVLLADSVPPTQRLRGVLELAIVVAIILSFTVVTVFQSLLPAQSSEARWAALYAHLANGLYVNTVANRWLLRFWPSPPQQTGSGGGR